MKLDGKRIVITGGTDGIGAASALSFCQQGARVIIIGRSAKKGKDIVEKSTNMPSGTIEFLQADFSSMKTAKSVAGMVASKMDGTTVDVLLHCVGILIGHVEHTKEGIEKDFAVGYLSRFVFTEELYSLKMLSSKTIMINVAASGPKVPSFLQLEFDDQEEVERRTGMKSHGQAQLANDLWVAANKYNLICIGYGPGSVSTGIRRELPQVMVWLVAPFFMCFTRKPEQVAEQFVDILSNLTLQPGQVAFYDKKGNFPIAEFVNNSNRQNDVYKMSSALAEKALSHVDTTE